MKSTPEKKKLKIKPDFIITFIVILLIGVISFFNVLEKLDYRIYDFLLKIKPAITQRQDVMTVNVDDASLERLGVWPWSRDILGDAIIRMRELGAKAAVFDIEYIEEAPLGIDPKIVQKMPDTFSASKETISAMVKELSEAIANGSLPPAYANEMADQLLEGYLDPAFNELYDATAAKILRDNDEYFAKAIRYFGNTWLTINATKLNDKINPDLEKMVRERFLLDNVVDEGGFIAINNKYYDDKQNVEGGMTPAIKKLLEVSSGAGFTNVVIDSDGSRRRIELLRENEGQYIGQLVFAPMLKLLDAQGIERKKNKLIVKQAKFPGEERRRDIKIPLDEHGRMLINWVTTRYEDSFKYESVFFLHDIDEIEAHVIEKLGLIGSFRLGDETGSMLPYYDAVQYLLGEYDKLTAQKAALFDNTDDDYEAYFSARSQFFEECKELFNPEYLSQIELVLDSIKTEENRDEIEEIKTAVKQKFVDFQSDHTLYMTRFNELKARYNDCVCIIGNTASGSTDLGVMPFYERYPNVGTHANVYNMIMENKFIVPIPWTYGFIIASILIIVIVASVRKLRARYQNIIGISGIFLFPVISVSLMFFARIYFPMLIPTLIMTLCFIGTTVLRFVMSERDKRFLRHAFSTYLSNDVVDEIVSDPKKLTLGGEEKNLTAIFTDIRGFSTISEKVTPTQLVSFLNKYLTLLSDIILENHGTIDKYEGDAIIAFYGAPISFEDHAWKACYSAIRMKQAEKAFNEEMLANGTIPLPVYTRIGINTGAMVVGNMGTDKKMNYTMMGNAVNLAARLEGVNKVYHSWILVSETTWNAANSGANAGKMLARRLDKVRVIGINTPVQLYNIVGLKSELPDEQMEAVKIFHQGLDRYLQRDFVNAKKFFDLATRTYPEDEQSQVFSERCDVNIRDGVPIDWDGVVNMTSK